MPQCNLIHRAVLTHGISQTASKTSLEGQFDWTPASAHDPLIQLYMKTAVLRAHLGAPVYNSLDCLRLIFNR